MIPTWLRASPAITMALLAFASCGGNGRAPSSAPGAASCRIALGPRATSSDGGAPPVVAPSSGPTMVTARSTLVVHAEVPLAGVKQSLEAKVPVRVAEERDHDIGIAGRLQYTVDRGPFAVSVQGDALDIEAPLHAHAQACAKGRCYAGCDPEARVTARVPLRLGADYRFRPSSVRIDVTRGCEIKAFGLVRIDVTPILQSRLALETKQIEASVDHELPDLRPEAQRMWTEMSRPRPLPLGACVVLSPEGVTEGPPSGTGDLARLRFGIYAHPELRVRCGDAPRQVPLPKLGDDPALPDVGDMHLAVVLPPEAPSIALSGSNDAFDLGHAQASIRDASGPASALVVDLTGDACGAVGVSASGAAWGSDGRGVHLTGTAPLPGDADRLTSAGLDASALAKAVENASIAVPFAADDLRAALPELARAVSDDRVAVAATVADASPEIAGLRGGEVVAVVRVHFEVTLRAKSFSATGANR